MRRRTGTVVGATLVLLGLTAAPVGHPGADRRLVTAPAAAPGPSSTSSSTTTTAEEEVVAPPAPGEGTQQTAPRSGPAAGPDGAAKVRDDPILRRGASASLASAPRGAPPAQGRLVIPRLGLDTVTYEGADLAQIDYGPSHIPGTAQPGHAGNAVFAGHRVTRTHPFRDLDALQPGDTATFVMPSGTFTYAYESTIVVDEDGVEILRQGPGHTATIFACHPPGSDRYRIVTRWRLVSAPSTDPDPAPASGAAAPAPDFGTGRGGGSGYLGPATTTTTTTTPVASAPPSGPSSAPRPIQLPGR